MKNSGETIPRRRYLVSTATAISAVALAGCTETFTDVITGDDEIESVAYGYIEHLEERDIEAANSLVHPDTVIDQHPALYEYESHSVTRPLTDVVVDEPGRVVMELGGTMVPVGSLTAYDVDYTIELRPVEKGVWRVWSVEADDPEKHDWIGAHD